MLDVWSLGQSLPKYIVTPVSVVIPLQTLRILLTDTGEYLRAAKHFCQSHMESIS